MSSMDAAVLTAAHSISIEQVEVPTLEADQVLVRVAVVGVCGSDVHYYEHGRIGPYVVDRPLILGHELSGRIEEVGADVDPGRVGQRVAIEPQRPCKVCRECRAGRYNLCPDIEFFATPPVDGAFAELIAIQSEFAYELPENVSYEAAALLEPLSVGIWACKRGGVEPGSRVLIAGAGPIGVILAQTARAFGASEVLVTDIDPGRREFVSRFGATRVIDPVAGGLQGLDVDVFIDATGVPAAVRSGVEAVGPGGRVVLVGLGSDRIEFPISHIQNREIWVTGVFRYANTWPLAIDLVSSGRVNLDALVTSRFGLAETEHALTVGREPGEMKAVVYPSM